MTFYITIQTDTRLTHIPYIDALTISVNGEVITCHWDETDAFLAGNHVNYRFKGISFLNAKGENEYTNGKFNSIDKVAIEEILWREDSDPEEFEVIDMVLCIDDKNASLTV